MADSDRQYSIGIDLGGTFIKGGIIDENGRMLVKGETPTETAEGEDRVVSNIAGLCESLMHKAGLEKDRISGIGVGAPGMIDGKKGVVICSGNFGWLDMPLEKRLRKATGMKVKIANDANVAALGEARFGAAKAYKSSVFVTLGTGVGGGIIIDGKIFEGNNGGGAEIGHMIIRADGEPCTCGINGCFEAYASATALIRDTKRAMTNDRGSKMWETGIDNVDGKTAFDYAEKGDAAAKAVVDSYLKMLGIGLINIANIFRPEAIIIGGGISHQKGIQEPLYRYVNNHKFARDRGPEVKVEIASLKNDAGTYGAAALMLHKKKRA